ncbi:uncharacterized protein CELE_K10G4.15 [Caenorhabditis elegans]|uniref:Secreted protein n=1 Tax=Caenorhabditis elegans TaxID=6239 RepID=G5EGT2_CAEEL|nr:Secreted protein [Caenorhabditis elegans]NP_001256738.1 Secreted protein [Caenorhabditis elegans]CCC42185.1 Secreted protein [Caenorhabditis elegans]CCD31101.1 Secreted protein [Caenorhabditis elegans]|eukprot:NP_001256737.1 Uncharacterized protein CELE_K10G4.16 [Caenorhabditis elegans]
MNFIVYLLVLVACAANFGFSQIATGPGLSIKDIGGVSNMIGKLTEGVSNGAIQELSQLL